MHENTQESISLNTEDCFTLNLLKCYRRIPFKIALGKMQVLIFIVLIHGSVYILESKLVNNGFNFTFLDTRIKIPVFNNYIYLSSVPVT